ncbi:uncharacterized protein LOC143890563 [Tasmannia lanceolata]|uniref:uncharacterized protein LOC143890563 n=1 Tax=Tasmannia lanceolata TaxID=3420 RepID=UPI0040640D00
MKVPLSSFHLESEALQWFQWYEKVHKNMEWKGLTLALCVRFGPTDFHEFDSTLNKLQQTASVREYQKQFERLSNMVEGWTEKALVGTFVGGLKDELAGEVQVFCPKTLNDAIGLARMIEEKIQHGQIFLKGTMIENQYSTLDPQLIQILDSGNEEEDE